MMLHYFVQSLLTGPRTIIFKVIFYYVIEKNAYFKERNLLILKSYLNSLTFFIIDIQYIEIYKKIKITIIKYYFLNNQIQIIFISRSAKVRFEKSILHSLFQQPRIVMTHVTNVAGDPRRSDRQKLFSTRFFNYPGS